MGRPQLCKKMFRTCYKGSLLVVSEGTSLIYVNAFSSKIVQKMRYVAFEIFRCFIILYEYYIICIILVYIQIYAMTLLSRAKDCPFRLLFLLSFPLRPVRTTTLRLMPTSDVEWHRRHVRSFQSTSIHVYIWQVCKYSFNFVFIHRTFHMQQINMCMFNSSISFVTTLVADMLKLAKLAS